MCLKGAFVPSVPNPKNKWGQRKPFVYAVSPVSPPFPVEMSVAQSQSPADALGSPLASTSLELPGPHTPLGPLGPSDAPSSTGLKEREIALVNENLFRLISCQSGPLRFIF